MKPRWTIVVVSGCVALILGSLTWYFVRSQLNNRQLAKDAEACRIRAAQGDAESQFKLGSMYYHGKGAPQDYGEAIRWYRKSAEQGYAKAEYNLSNMYHDGRGVTPDNVEAERWCRKAAEQGDARAQAGLGYLYYRGEGVPQNLAEAARWFQKSADQGFAEGQYDLGSMYYYGYGVPQDKAEADRLFHQAAANGSEDARRFLGLNRACAPATTMTKIVLALKFIVSLAFGIPFLKSKAGHRTRAQMVLGVAALLVGFSFGLDVFWYFYLGHLQPSAAVTALYFVRHLVGGAVIGVLAYIVHRNSPRTVLVASVLWFIGFTLFRVALFDLRHVPLTIRSLCSAGSVAFPIGMSIPSVIFLRLGTQETRQSTGDGTTAPFAAK